MIYNSKFKLDMGNEIQMRIGKTEKLRLTSHNLNDHIKQYTILLEKTLNCEKLILKDLDFLNSGYSHYEPLCHNLKNALVFKNEITTKQITNLRRNLKKSNEIEKKFESLRPFIKKYFNSLKKLTHYKEKLPKIRDLMSSKQKRNGKLSDKETNKLIRNERKLKTEEDNTKLSSDKIIKETNKLNIKRFDFQNPILKEFISFQVSTCYLMQEKYHILDNFEKVLSTPQTPDFNDRFFLNVTKGSKIHFKTGQTDKMMKQNIQNNYYYINDGKDINENKGLPENQRQFKPGQSFGNDRKNLGYSNPKGKEVLALGNQKGKIELGSGKGNVELGNGQGKPMALPMNDNKGVIALHPSK